MRSFSRWTLAVLTILAAVGSVSALGIASAATAAKAPKTLVCTNVTANGGKYKATNIRVTGIKCSVARKNLASWLKQGSKSLPHNRTFWHSKRIAGGRWMAEYGRKKIHPTITFRIVAVPKPPAPKPPTPAPPTPTPPAAPAPQPAADTAAPAVHLVSPLNGEKLEAGTVVTAQFSCTDNVAVTKCVSTFPAGAAIPTNVLGDHQFAVTAVDSSGNVTSVIVTYTVVDTSPPQISITAPAVGASYTWSQAATALFSCSDAVGLASCTADVGGAAVANGAALPTNGAPGPGTRTLTVTAKDTSGNTSTQKVSYVVQPAGYYALTFHDGPDPTYTVPVLNALKSVNAHATFFLIGVNAQSYSSTAKQEVAAGMQIGNHSMNHLDVGPTTLADRRTPNPFFVAPAPGTGFPPAGGMGDTPTLEVTKGRDAIIAATGVTPKWFEPPYGDYGYDATVQNMVTAAGETLCAWTVDSTDSDVSAPTSAAIIAAATNVEAGGIIEMHDASQATVDSVVPIVNQLAANKGLLPGQIIASTAGVPGPFGDPQPAFYCTAGPWPGA